MDVLAAGFIAHLGVIVDGAPMVVPTSYGFDEETAFPARLRRQPQPAARIRRGGLACVTITLADGLVLARSVFEHAVNYRSAMIYGIPRPVTDAVQKLRGLRLLSEHLAPGQWDYVRQPSRKELAATVLLALPLDEASVKISTGPPDDGDSEDVALGLWAGELPLITAWGEPVPDHGLPGGHRGAAAHCRQVGHQGFPAAPLSSACLAAGRGRLAGLSDDRLGRRLADRAILRDPLVDDLPPVIEPAELGLVVGATRHLIDRHPPPLGPDRLVHLQVPPHVQRR